MSKNSSSKAKNGGNDEQIREMNAELLVSSVRQHELTERAEAAEAELLASEEALIASNTELGRSNRNLELANAEALAERLSALNLKDEAVEARNLAETLNKQLQREMTERELAAAALRTSEEKYRSLFNSIDEGFCTIEVLFDDGGKPFNYRFLEANPAFAAQTGFENFIGRTMLDFAPRMEQFWFDLYGEVALTGEPRRVEHEARELGRFYDVYASPTGERGENRVAVVFNDISRRKRSEEAVRHAREFAEATLRSSPVPLLVLESDLSVVMANEAFYKHFQAASALTECRKVYELGNGQWNIPGLRELLEDILPHESWFENFEVEHKFESIGWKTMLLNARRMEPIEGGPERIILVIEDITDRKLAENALRANAETFAALVERSPLGIYTVDADFCVANVSAGSMHAFRNVHPLVGRDFAEVVQTIWPEPFASDVAGIFRRVIETGEPYVSPGLIETRVDLGSTETYEWQVNRVMLADGRNGAVCYFYDTTRIYLANQALRESEEKYRVLFESMDEGYCIIEFLDGPHGPLSDYVHIEANPAYTMNARIPDVVGQKVREMVPDEAEGWVEIYRNVLITGEPVRFERELVATGRHLELSAFRIEPAEKRQVAVLFRDITLRKQADEFRARLAAIVESSDDAIISKDLDGIIKTWNEGAEKVFGYTAWEAVGRPVTLLMPPERLDEEPYILDRIRHGQTVDHYETVRRRKDGSDLNVSLTVSPIRDEAGKIIGASKVARDVTERIVQEERLSRAYDELEARVEQRTSELALTNQALTIEIEERKALEKIRAELVHSIVGAQEDERKRIARDLHDQLGQRLTALRLKLASLRDNVADSLQAESVDQLVEIASLLDSDVSFLAAELRPTSLDDFGLQEALRIYATDWSILFGINVEFHSNVGTDARLSEDVETHFYRIAQEALNNISKHAKASEVAVTLERSKKGVVLVVEDNGIGFDTSAAPESLDGHGYGLAGIAERAKLIRGEFEVESNPGTGTTIYVRIPH